MRAVVCCWALILNLAQHGVDALEAEDLVGRRGGLAGTLSLSFAGGASNRAGNDEALSAELGESMRESNLVAENNKLKEENSKFKERNNKLKKENRELKQEHSQNNVAKGAAKGGKGTADVYELGETSGYAPYRRAPPPSRRQSQSQRRRTTPRRNSAPPMSAGKLKKKIKKALSGQDVQMPSGAKKEKGGAKLEVDKASAEKTFERHKRNVKYYPKQPGRGFVAQFVKAPTSAACTRLLVGGQFEAGPSTEYPQRLGNMACKGGATKFLWKTAYRPYMDENLKLSTKEVCGLVGGAGSGVGGGYGVDDKVKKLGLNLDEEIKRLKTNPKMFVGFKQMCCDDTKCVTLKLCTNLKAMSCIGL